MDKEEFLLNKDLIGEVVSSSTEYFKIIAPSSEDALNNQISELYKEKEKVVKPSKLIKLDQQAYFDELAKDKELSALEDNKGLFSITASSDTEPTSYKRMTTTITKLNTNTYRLKNSVTWDKLPFY
ncbi:hypothetical protein ACOI1C_11380 [Bacillus sp. DJP31]|uniref:hypothetical protein n=1 Tax=Bacillus sp. DJP31 TaxID=3409789 RepID=UPI003BB78C05